MGKVIKILGSPGTGKTSKCLDIIENELSNGLDPEDLLYTTFTRAAPEEAKSRIKDRNVDIDDDVLKRNWNNIHSICFKMLGLSRKNVATHNERKEFCSKLGIQYAEDIDSIDSSEVGLKEEESGNKLFTAYDWLRARHASISPGNSLYKMAFDDNNLWAIDHKEDPWKLMQLWEKYKKREDLLDYIDMLSGTIRMGLVPDSKVMLIDEFQDISQIDYELYKLWKDKMERVYIAGDPPQAIYSFRGASPEYLLNEDSDKEIILGKSHRVPSKIWNEAEKVVKAMDMDYFEVEPDREGGTFKLATCDMNMSELEKEVFDELYGDHEEHDTFTDFTGEEMFGELDESVSNGQDVMALFRTRFEATDFQDRLIMVGIPFESMRGYEVWRPQIRNLRDGIVELRDEGDTSGQKKRAVNKLLDDYIWDVKEDDVMEEAVKIIKSRSQIEDDWSDRTLTAREYPMNTWQTRAVINNLESGREYLSPSDVRVGTKHSAKGKESDVVIMSLDTSFKISNNCYYQSEDKLISDDEKRVDFVAMTRAKDRLFIQESAWKGIPNHTLEALQGVSR